MSAVTPEIAADFLIEAIQDFLCLDEEVGGDFGRDGGHGWLGIGGDAWADG